MKLTEGRKKAGKGSSINRREFGTVLAGVGAGCGVAEWKGRFWRGQDSY